VNFPHGLKIVIGKLAIKGIVKRKILSALTVDVAIEFDGERAAANAVRVTRTQRP
jgi:hypothetical protein